MKPIPIAAIWLTVILSLGGPIAPTADAQQAFLGVITGDRKGTAHQIGMDLKALLLRNDIHLAVFDSNGSVENIYAVYQRPGNHLGIVQSDVLAFVAKVDIDYRLRLIADKVKLMSPLYDQQVHILAASAVRRLEDLHDRRVDVGHPRSGTHLTSRLLLAIAGIRPRQLTAVGQGQALEALKAGQIDAMIVVDGAPVPRLALDVAAADGLHLVPITQSAIRDVYPASRIAAETYPWQTTEVATVSVKAVLVAYDFRNHHCPTIGTVGRLIAANMAWLRSNGHPAWQTVDLTVTVPGWQPYPCLQQAAPQATDADDVPMEDRQPNPVADAIEAMLSR